MSQLRTNSIVPVGGIPAGASGGGIIQIVESSLSNTGSTTSSTLVNTGLSASITPRSTSSKILCIFSLAIRNDGQRSGIGLARNGTSIWGYQEAYPQTTAASAKTFQFLDSPSTTSSITYAVQYRVNGGTALLSDVGGIDPSGSNPHRITLLEISG